MSASYQTENTTTEKDVLVNKEPSPSHTMLKKLGIAALVGTAFVVGNSYGSSMNTPKTEIEAFLAHANDLAVVNGPTSCSGLSTMYSVSPFTSNTVRPGETICGQLCLIPALVDPVLGAAPNPKPVKGDCPSVGFKSDTGGSFNSIPFPPNSGKFLSARVFTR
mmetsp:Transcript_2059/g.2363  ORF Transcript_2059/g.2363 Transcript_2059/m.2363 type:complete len:163 (+) Transcript_2059:71-559(+)